MIISTINAIIFDYMYGSELEMRYARHREKWEARKPDYLKQIDAITKKLTRVDLGDLSLTDRQLARLCWNLEVLKGRYTSGRTPDELYESNPQQTFQALTGVETENNRRFDVSFMGFPSLKNAIPFQTTVSLF